MNQDKAQEVNKNEAESPPEKKESDPPKPEHERAPP